MDRRSPDLRKDAGRQRDNSFREPGGTVLILIAFLRYVSDSEEKEGFPV